MFRRLVDFCFLAIAEGFLRFFPLVWRIKIENEPSLAGRPHLYAHWHGDELLLVPVFAGRGYAVMASRSRDGGKMGYLLIRLGYHVVRGSSSRGGAGGLKGLVDAIRLERRCAAVAVDGPRGPAFQAKPGVFFLAQTTGVPISPVVGFAKYRWAIPGAWNQGYLPKPFAKCVILFGDPLTVPADCDDQQREVLRLELEKRLHALKAQAEQHCLKTRSCSRLYFWDRHKV